MPLGLTFPGNICAHCFRQLPMLLLLDYGAGGLKPRVSEELTTPNTTSYQPTGFWPDPREEEGRRRFSNGRRGRWLGD